MASAHISSYRNLYSGQPGEMNRGLKCRRKDKWSCTQMKEQRDKNKPFVILNSSNTAEQLHLPSCLQSIILSPAPAEHALYFLYQHIWVFFKVIPASIFKVLKILNWSSFCTRQAFCLYLNTTRPDLDTVESRLLRGRRHVPLKKKRRI